MKRAICFYTTMMLGALTVLSAQASLKFEVASIRLQPANAAPGPAAAPAPGTQPGRTFTHAGSIRALLQRAYGLPYVQQMGGPDWIREDVYIIRAMAPESVPLTPENVTVMVRALLEERFKLVAREETREMPVYALVAARADRALGPNLRPYPADCQARRNDARQNGQPTPDECGTNVGSRPNGMRGRNASMTSLANLLQFAALRPVIDRTGLAHTYNFDLNFEASTGPAAADSQLPSLFTALQEQLGLKLESQRAPVQVLVIDSIQRPTEN